MQEEYGRPFQGTSYELMQPAGASLSLEPMGSIAASELATAISRIDPWKTLRIDPEKLVAYLIEGDDHSCRRVIRYKAERAGVVGIRNPWLYGPYLAMLAVLPAYQRAGIGSAILQWIEREAQRTASNIWACVSSFNSRAGLFYERHGFVQVGTLDDLLQEGHSERLMRKRLK